MMTANINRGEKTPPYEDVSLFLPYPSQWLIDNTEQKFRVSAKVAREFLNTYEEFDIEVGLAFTAWMTTIQVCAIE